MACWSACARSRRSWSGVSLSGLGARLLVSSAWPSASGSEGGSLTPLERPCVGSRGVFSMSDASCQSGEHACCPGCAAPCPGIFGVISSRLANSESGLCIAAWTSASISGVFISEPTGVDGLSLIARRWLGGARGEVRPSFLTAATPPSHTVLSTSMGAAPSVASGAAWPSRESLDVALLLSRVAAPGRLAIGVPTGAA